MAKVAYLDAGPLFAQWQEGIVRPHVEVVIRDKAWLQLALFRDANQVDLGGAGMDDCVVVSARAAACKLQLQPAYL